MEKDRDTRIIAVVALIVGVLALTVGFASYTLDYLLEGKTHAISAAGNFRVGFTIDKDKMIFGDVKPETSDDVSATIANASKTIITNLNATFTEPGQSVVYKLYSINEGTQDVFLKAVTYGNVDSRHNFMRCIPGAGTTKAYIEEACNDIHVKIKVGNDEYSSSRPEVSGHILPKDFSEDIIVTIYYDSNGHRADGPFRVVFGDIGLTYSIQD